MISSTSSREVTTQVSYQNRLRAIGRHLDRQRFRRVTVLDVAGGLVAHGVPRSSLEPQGVEFPETRIRELMEEAGAERGRGASYGWRTELLPTGYEDFLRAIGRELDRHVARQVVIAEHYSFVTVSGLEPDYTPTGHTSFKPFEWMLSAGEIHRLLDSAFNCRSHAGFLDRRRRARLLKLKRSD